MDLIISIKEAKKLLGKSSYEMTDDEVEKLITVLDGIARLTIQALLNGTMKIPPEFKKSK